MSLRIYSWNMNGIRAVIRKELLEPFIEHEAPDILCIQETKAQPNQVELELPGYEQFWNSAERKGYSGTAIFSKVKPLQVVSDLPEHLTKKHGGSGDSYGDPNTEGRVLAAEFEDFWLVTVYTPNAKDDLSRIPLRHDHWDPAFLEYCKELEEQKPVIFCGDLNVAHKEIDLARPKQNEGKKGFTAEERAGFDSFINAGFVDTFRMFNQEGDNYTWWSHWGKARERNVGWRIDYVLVSESLKNRVKAAKIHPDVRGSDHCPVSIEIE